MLVNNVGGSKQSVPFLDLPDTAWQEAFELNFFTAVRLCRACSPASWNATDQS